MLRQIPAPRILVPRLLIFAGLMLCGSALRADSIYSNFLPGNGYSDCCGIFVVDDGVDTSLAIELPALNADYLLTSIEFVASSDTPDPSNSVTMSVYAGNGDVPGGSPLESLTLNGALSPFDGTTLAPVLTVTSVTHPELYAGTRYWVVMDGPTSESLVWDLNNTPGSNGYVQTDGTAGNWVNLSPDSTNGVFEIDGTIIPGSAPEPQAWLLMAGGLIATARFARRRQYYL